MSIRGHATTARAISSIRAWVKYLRVKNWERFQHYGERRTPPWIKLYRTLLTDYEFGKLADAAKAHLILIWLYAAERDGFVPNDPDFVRARIGVQDMPDLASFTKLGFLVEDDSAMTNHLRREELETDKEKNKKRYVLALLAREFNEFWSLYPKKVAKQEAMKAWRQLLISQDERELLMKKLASTRWDEDRKFIPYPATWLRGRRWEDEESTVAKRQNASKRSAWWASEQSTLEKAGNVGIKPRPGESWNDLRGRIAVALEEIKAK